MWSGIIFNYIDREVIDILNKIIVFNILLFSKDNILKLGNSIFSISYTSPRLQDSITSF
jgi:hypothetical protein